MRGINEVISALMGEVKERRELIETMVGALYPSILLDEIDLLLSAAMALQRKEVAKVLLEVLVQARSDAAHRAVCSHPGYTGVDIMDGTNSELLVEAAKDAVKIKKACERVNKLIGRG